MLIIDGHEDLAWNALVLGRDLTWPLEAIRAAEGAAPAHGEGVATTCLPALRAAGVQVVLATLYATPYGEKTPLRRQGYRTPEEAYAQGRAQVEYYHGLAERGEATIIRARADLDGVLAGTLPAPGFVLLMEGADPLRTPEDLAAFVDRGVRLVGLAWGATRYAGGAGAPGPLTAAGRALLTEMARLGVALDVSHLAEEACWEALERFPGLVVASHSNCRALVPTDRQLSDAMLRALADRGGVAGLVFYNRFIRPDWKDGNPKAAVTLRDLLAHADHVTRLIGTEHLALGTDLDGGVGREVVPGEIDSVADLPRVADALAAAGYSPAAIAGIMGENWLRVLRGILG
jgi:membrane dipeptidase